MGRYGNSHPYWILLLFFWKIMGKGQVEHSGCNYIKFNTYPNSLRSVVDNSFEYSSSAGTELALHFIHLFIFALPLHFQIDESTAPFAFPPIVGGSGVALIDFPTVMFDMYGTLAKGAGDHEIFIDGFVGETGLALAGGLSGGGGTIRIFYRIFLNYFE